jgi:hypothetical protein
MSAAQKTRGAAGFAGFAGFAENSPLEVKKPAFLENLSETPAKPAKPAGTPPERPKTGAIGGGRPPRPRVADPEPRATTRSASGRVCGAAHPCSAHSDEQVFAVRTLAAQGMTHTAIGQRLGIPRSTVSYWVRGARRPEPVRTSVDPRWRRVAGRREYVREAVAALRATRKGRQP